MGYLLMGVWVFLLLNQDPKVDPVQGQSSF